MADRFADDELFEVEVDHDFVSANVERCSVSVDVLHLHTDTRFGSEHLERPLLRVRTTNDTVWALTGLPKDFGQL